jgi:cell division protein FtsI (penicillin-binding protein 3)
VLDGKTGEALALASWPVFDPNDGGAASERARLSRATGALFEMGSTVKPFTVAMGLQSGVVTSSTRFDLTAPVAVGGTSIRDAHPHAAAISVSDALVYSSNQAMATIAVKTGTAPLRTAFANAGLFESAPIEGLQSATPVVPARPSPLDAAAMAYGYAFSTTPMAVAGAYTVFVNQGRRAAPTILRRDPAGPIPSVDAFDNASAGLTLDLMRDVVVEGTAREATALQALDIAGKTGTAEKTAPAGGYDPDRVLASFVAIFPASAPRYVIFVALDEPARLPQNNEQITGGALAAPVVGRIAAALGPLLGLDMAAWRGDVRQALLDGDDTP